LTSTYTTMYTKYSHRFRRILKTTYEIGRVYCIVGNILHLMCDSFPRSEARNWIFFLAAKTTCNYVHVVSGAGEKGEQITRHNRAYRENAFTLQRHSFLLRDPPTEGSRLDRKLIRKKGSSDATYKEVIDFFVRVQCSAGRRWRPHRFSAPQVVDKRPIFFFYRCNLKHHIELTNIIYHVSGHPWP